MVRPGHVRLMAGARPLKDPVRHQPRHYRRSARTASCMPLTASPAPAPMAPGPDHRTRRPLLPRPRSRPRRPRPARPSAAEVPNLGCDCQGQPDGLGVPGPAGSTRCDRRRRPRPADLPDRRSTATAGTIDLLGIVSASQALSSETIVDRLHARVVEVLSAMTGATGVHLLLWSEDRHHSGCCPHRTPLTRLIWARIGHERYS
jgi:hypothetical protein